MLHFLATLHLNFLSIPKIIKKLPHKHFKKIISFEVLIANLAIFQNGPFSNNGFSKHFVAMFFSKYPQICSKYISIFIFSDFRRKVHNF